MTAERRQTRMLGIRRTTTFRLTAMLGLAFLAAVCALLALVYVLTERELLGRTDDVLDDAARALTEVPAARLPQAVVGAVAAHTSHLNHYALLDAQGRSIAGDFRPPASLRSPRRIELSAGPDGTPALRVLAARTGNGGLLVIARDITQIADLRHRVMTALLISGAAVSILILLAAVLLSASPLRRVRVLTALASRVAAGELELRMPVSGRGDELDVIATTINTMIAEIGRLLEQVKGATDAIAHDLRSPLANVRNRLENIRREAASPPSGNLVPEGVTQALDGACATPDQLFSGVIDTALQELDIILARFNALLRVAELEASSRRAGFGSLDPMALAAAVCELYEPLAEERDIRLVLSGTWGHIIEADEHLLFEVVGNLVENAIKFIPAGGSITVCVSRQGDTPVLEVRDDGPGIAPEERANVLRRFHRSPSAQPTPGSGLGLSLVAAIVHLHGFALELDDAGPGLVVRITCTVLAA